MITPISFGASFIQRMPIKKYSFQTETYTPSYANLVELSPHDLRDVSALDEIAFNFGNDSYADNIAFDAKKAYKRNNHKNEPFSAIALTTQEDNFEKLNANDVIGIAEIFKRKKGEIELLYLQTHPKYVYSLHPRKVKNIGTAILDYLKETHNKITLHSASSPLMFYIRNGFRMVSPDSFRLVWDKNFKKIK